LSVGQDADSTPATRDLFYVIDGEAVILGVDGVSDFDALHSGQHGTYARLYAFDVLAMDGDDLRGLPLSMRKAGLAKLRGPPDGMFIAPFEAGEIGPDLFRAACRFSLEGIVSKRRDRPYRAGVTGLGQGEEPGVTGHDASEGCRVVERGIEITSSPCSTAACLASSAAEILSGGRHK
jgi:hypothetical protein